MRVDRIAVRILMLQKNLKQKDVIEKSGMTRSTISPVLCGKSCSKETAEKIAAALNVDLNQIIERN